MRLFAVFSFAFVFLVFAGLASAVTNVSECMNLSIPNEVYEINQTLYGNQSGGTCLIVDGENATLNCKSFTLYGDASSSMGIAVFNTTGVTVFDCFVDGYDSGYYNLYANHTFFSNINGFRSDFGMGVMASEDVEISDSYFASNITGMVFFLASNITFLRSSVSRSIFVQNVSNGFFSELVGNSSVSYALAVLDSDNVSFYSSSFGNGSIDAITVQNSNASFNSITAYNQSKATSHFLEVRASNASFFDFIVANDDQSSAIMWDYFNASNLDLQEGNNLAINSGFVSVNASNLTGQNSSATIYFSSSVCNGTRYYAPFTTSWAAFDASSANFTPSGYVCDVGNSLLSFVVSDFSHQSYGLGSNVVDYSGPDLSISSIVPNPNKKIFMQNENVSFTVIVFNGGSSTETAAITVSFSNGGGASCSAGSLLPFTSATVHCGINMINESAVTITASVAAVAGEVNVANNQKSLSLSGQSANPTGSTSVPDSSPLLAAIVGLLACLLLARKRK